MKKRILSQLITVRLDDDPRDIATELLDIALSDATEAEKASGAGQVIDDALVLGGPVGGILETLDGPAAAHLAGVAQELIGQAHARIVAQLATRIEEAEERLRDRGVPESAIEAIREALRIDELAA